MRTLYTHLMLAVMLLAPIGLIGCGDKGAGAGSRATVYKTKGKVTYLGNPLIDAAVSFSPQGKQPAAVGRTNDNGEFTLTTYRAGDGAAEGEYKVMITMTVTTPASTEIAHGTDPTKSYGESHSGKKGKTTGNVLPAIFSDAANTPLSEKVEANGKNEFVFNLK